MRGSVRMTPLQGWAISKAIPRPEPGCDLLFFWHSSGHACHARTCDVHLQDGILICACLTQIFLLMQVLITTLMAMGVMSRFAYVSIALEEGGVRCPSVVWMRGQVQGCRVEQGAARSCLHLY